MRATDLVGINGITRVLLVYTCQQGVYPRGHILTLRPPSQLTPYKDEMTGDGQCGRRVAAQSLTDRISNVRQILQIKWECSGAIHNLFVDIIEASDSRK
jgi:hypothetical protein